MQDFTSTINHKTAGKSVNNFYREALGLITEHMKTSNLQNEAKELNISFDFTNKKKESKNIRDTNKNIDNRKDHQKRDVNNREILASYINNNKIEHKIGVLLEDLRFLSLKYVLEDKLQIYIHYHAVFHLLYLVTQKNIPYHLKLNDWLNVNFSTKDIKIDAMRGNFGRITSQYKEMEEVIHEFFKIERVCNKENVAREKRSNSVLSKSYDNLIKTKIDKNETYDECNLIGKFKKIFISEKKEKTLFEVMQNDWKKSYKEKIPKEIRSIFLGELKDYKHFWADFLCYELLFVKRKDGEFIKRKEDLIDVISESNLFSDILCEKFDDAFMKSDDFLKLILFLTCNMDSVCVESIFERIGKMVHQGDYKLSLMYFSFSKKLPLYYSFIAKNIKLEEKVIEFLYNFGIENDLEIDTLLDRYCEILHKRRKFYELLAIVDKYSFKYKDCGADNIIEFCINNYDLIKDILKKETLSESIYKFVQNMNSLNNEIELEESEYVFLVECKYSKKYFTKLFEKLMAIKLSEKVLFSLLGIILKLEKDDSYKNKKHLHTYKKIVVEKFNE